MQPWINESTTLDFYYSEIIINNKILGKEYFFMETVIETW